MDFRVPWFPLPPYWIGVKNQANGTGGYIFYGRDYLVLEGMAEKFNFTIRVLPLDLDFLVSFATIFTLVLLKF